MKVSLIMITIDREDIVKQTLTHILNNTGYDNWELCVADNGSTDNVSEYIKSLNPAVHILNGENKGVAYTLNQLIKQSSGELICHIGNDIVMDDNWMQSMVEHQQAIPSTGVCAVHTVEVLPPLVEIGGKNVHLNKIVFGPKMYRKKLVENQAYKEFSKYGLEDSDLSLRFYYKGYYNYYIPNIKGSHIGHDCNQDTEYRKMKNEELAKAQKGFIESINKYKAYDISRY